MVVTRVTSRPHGRAFTSKSLPRYVRRSLRLEETLPVLYLHGLPTGDSSETLEALPGPEAAGFSATTICRLLKARQDECRLWRKRSLESRDCVYIWTDGVDFNVRLEENRLACLVIRASGRGVGVLPDGREEGAAIQDGIKSQPNRGPGRSET